MESPESVNISLIRRESGLTTGYTKPLMKRESWAYATIFTRSATAPDTTVAAVAVDWSHGSKERTKRCIRSLTADHHYMIEWLHFPRQQQSAKCSAHTALKHKSDLIHAAPKQALLHSTAAFVRLLGDFVTACRRLSLPKHIYSLSKRTVTTGSITTKAAGHEGHQAPQEEARGVQIYDLSREKNDTCSSSHESPYTHPRCHDPFLATATWTIGACEMRRTPHNRSTSGHQAATIEEYIDIHRQRGNVCADKVDPHS